jgi:hypothetical protein
MENDAENSDRLGELLISHPTRTFEGKCPSSRNQVYQPLAKHQWGLVIEELHGGNAQDRTFEGG